MRFVWAVILAVALVSSLPMVVPSQAAVAAAKKKKKTKKRKTTRRARKPVVVPVSPKARAAARTRVASMVEKSATTAIENPAALVPFFEQLYRHQNGEAGGPLRILHYGDSHTAADEWTGAMRNASLYARRALSV